MKVRHFRPAWRFAMVAALLPLALASTAQDSNRWWGGTVSRPSTPAQDEPQQQAREPRLQADARTRMREVAPDTTPLDIRRFEAIANTLVANGRIPGMAMAIVKDGRILSARGYGITDVSNAEPVDAHTVFRLASLSKPFAGTVTGMLVNDGVLRWDSHLTDYVPAFQLAQPGAAQSVTVADILSHRLGLTRNAFDRDIERNADYRSLTRCMANAPMTCAPGDCYAYQNVGFSLIGDIVFATTGQFFSETVARRIFKPLGMDDASYGLEGIQASPRWAKPHVRAGGGWRSLMPKPTYYRVAPAAGVNASISDMAQWLLAQTGHRPDVLPAPLLATLHSPLVATPTEIRGSSWRRSRLNAAGYGLGWRVYDYAGNDVVFHAGAVQGYRGLMAMMPERDLGVVVLWNSESALPGGLLPTILDNVAGLTDGDWLNQDISEMLYAEEQQATPPGTGASASHTSPP